jgi:hypothetical protein
MQMLIELDPSAVQAIAMQDVPQLPQQAMHKGGRTWGR